jgi:hypothetical protein
VVRFAHDVRERRTRGSNGVDRARFADVFSTRARSFAPSGAAFDGGDPGRTYGGGVFVSGAAPTITDCVIEGNSVTGMGGGVFFHASAGRLLGGAVRDNFATGSGEGGAGVALFESTAAVHEVVIRGNTASGAGGGLLLRRSGGSIRYNFIVDNAAAEGAGLRQSGYGAAIVDGNVIADNLGEGVSFFEYSATKFIGNTVVGNTGHGVRLTLCCGPLFAVPLLRNDIIAYNDGRGIFTDSGPHGWVRGPPVRNAVPARPPRCSSPRSSPPAAAAATAAERPTARCSTPRPTSAPATRPTCGTRAGGPTWGRRTFPGTPAAARAPSAPRATTTASARAASACSA